MNVEEMTYMQAARELEEIRVRLDNEELDVDEVVDLVTRAKALVEHCRAKVTGAKAKIQTITTAQA